MVVWLVFLFIQRIAFGLCADFITNTTCAVIINSPKLPTKVTTAGFAAFPRALMTVN